MSEIPYDLKAYQAAKERADAVVDPIVNGLARSASTALASKLKRGFRVAQDSTDDAVLWSQEVSVPNGTLVLHHWLLPA